MEKKHIEDYKKEFKNIWFWIYFISLIVIVIIFYIFKENEFVNISSLFFLTIIQVLYGAFQVKASYNETFYQKYVGLGYGVFLFVFALINLAIKVDEKMTALAILFLFAGLVMVSITKYFFNRLWNSDSLFKIVFFYLLFAFWLNYSFAFGYTIISVPENSQIIDINGNKISGALDFVLFSYSIFYTSVTEYIPKGYSKILSIIQVTLSFLLHVIFLGCIIQSNLVFGKDKNSSEEV